VIPHLSTALFCALPLIIAGILHMLFVRLDLLPGLRVPIDEQRFGANKTWRGVVVMTVATMFGVLVTQHAEPTFAAHAPLLVSMHAASPVVLGVLLGLAYVLGELPNSYVKRRLGIAPGLLADRRRALFALVDQADSAVACMAVYAFMFHVPVATLAVACALGPAIHLLVNVNLYLVGLRKRPI
jgi:CDP-diacylglycerol--serine O-phosphatidyltransferase